MILSGFSRVAAMHENISKIEVQQAPSLAAKRQLRNVSNFLRMI